jgi:hypothetical protein
LVASADKEHNLKLSEMIKALGHYSLVVETGEHLVDTLQGQTFAALFLVLEPLWHRPRLTSIAGFEP